MNTGQARLHCLQIDSGSHQLSTVCGASGQTTRNPDATTCPDCIRILDQKNETRAAV